MWLIEFARSSLDEFWSKSVDPSILALPKKFYHELVKNSLFL